jgi:hypothetical protein
LPSITGSAAAGPDVAEAEHRGAVGDDCDGVGPPGVDVSQLGLDSDRHAHAGDARRVSEGEILAVAQRGRDPELDLPAAMHRESGIGVEDRRRDIHGHVVLVLVCGVVRGRPVGTGGDV